MESSPVARLPILGDLFMNRLFGFLVSILMAKSAFAEGVSYDAFSLLIDDVSSHQFSCRTDFGSFRSPTLRLKQFKKGVLKEIQIMSDEFDWDMDKYAYQTWAFVLIAYHPYYFFNEVTNSIEGNIDNTGDKEDIFQSLNFPIWHKYTSADPNGFFPYKMYKEYSYVVIPRERIYTPHFSFGNNILETSFQLSQDRKTVEKVSMSIFKNEAVNNGDLFEPDFEMRPKTKILSVSCDRLDSSSYHK